MGGCEPRLEDIVQLKKTGGGVRKWGGQGGVDLNQELKIVYNLKKIKQGGNWRV